MLRTYPKSDSVIFEEIFYWTNHILFLPLLYIWDSFIQNWIILKFNSKLVTNIKKLEKFPIKLLV